MLPEARIITWRHGRNKLACEIMKGLYLLLNLDSLPHILDPRRRVFWTRCAASSQFSLLFTWLWRVCYVTRFPLPARREHTIRAYLVSSLPLYGLINLMYLYELNTWGRAEMWSGLESLFDWLIVEKLENCQRQTRKFPL